MEKTEWESKIRKMARIEGDDAFDVKKFESVEAFIHWLRTESIVKNTRHRIGQELDFERYSEDPILDYLQLYFEYHAISWFEAHLQNEESGHYSREPDIEIDTTDYDKDMTKPELPARPIDAYYEKVLKTKVEFQHVLRNLRESTKQIESAIDGLNDELKKIRKAIEKEETQK